MSTNEHVGAEKFWPAEHGGPTDARPYESTAESVHEDATSAYKEAATRSENEAGISDDAIESLAHNFGGLKPALEYSRGMTEYYRANPIEAREKHYRDYASRPPRPMPEREPPAQPHPDLDERGLREWHLENDIRNAMREAPREQALKREREGARELLAQAAAELGTTPGKLIEQTAAVDMAMQTNPAHVSEKVARFFGKPVNEAHANEIVAAHVEQQEAARMGQWIKDVEASGSLPGFERQEVKTAMAQVIKDPNFPQSGSVEQDLVNAYSVVAQQVREHVEGEQRKEAAERARQASRSISGSSGSSVSESRYGDGDGSVEASARAAYASLSGNRV